MVPVDSPVEVDIQRMRGPALAVCELVGRGHALLTARVVAPAVDSMSWVGFDFVGVTGVHVLGHSVSPELHQELDAGLRLTDQIQAFRSGSLLARTVGRNASVHGAPSFHYAVDVPHGFDVHIVANACVVRPLAFGDLEAPVDGLVLATWPQPEPFELVS